MDTLHTIIFFGLPAVAVLLLGLRQRWGPIGTIGGAALADAASRSVVQLTVDGVSLR